MTLVVVLSSVVVLLTEIGSNFIIGVRNTTDHEPPQPIREAFSFCFLGQRLFVTIELIGRFDLKKLLRKPKVKYLWEIMKNCMENTMEK